MNFLKKHYEKLILAVTLLVFIISLILVILALSKSMDIKEEDLKFPSKAPDYKKVNPDEINYKKTLEGEEIWNPNTPRSQRPEGDKNFTDMLQPYSISRCPNPECQKLIPRSNFKEEGSCPFCKFALRPPESGGVGPKFDTDEDGMPDKWEKEMGLNPNDPLDANKDLDNDGFTNLEEYQAKTDPRDSKSHPALAKKLYVDSIKRSKLPIVLIKVTPHGDDMKTWTIQMDETMPNGSVKTRFYKLGNILNFNERKYTISDIKSEIIEEKVGLRGTTLKKTVFSIILQEEDGSLITATEKKEIWESKESAKLVDTAANKEYMVSVGEEVTLGEGKSVEKYKVKMVNSAKKKVVIIRLSDNTEYELAVEERKETPAPVNPAMPPAIVPGGMPPGGMPPGAMPPMPPQQ